MLSIVADLRKFQSTFNIMYTSIVELQDANKDVLLGKRQLNCLSCGETEAFTNYNNRSKRASDLEKLRLNPDQIIRQNSAKNNIRLSTRVSESGQDYLYRSGHNYGQEVTLNGKKNRRSLHSSLGTTVNSDFNTVGVNQTLNNKSFQASKQKLPFGFIV